MKLGVGKKRDARPAGGGHLHRQRRLKNLFEQFPLEHGGRRPYAKALALLQQDDLIGVFPSEIQFVSDDHDGVAVFGSQAAKIVK